MSKPYAQSESGGIHVKSGRKIGEVRMPNYVYDLWLPLIGSDALAAYGVYCRLERGKTVRAITMRDIAKACRIGDKKLGEVNAILAECGFITVRKPTGKARGRHFTTEITTLNPPRQIAAELVTKYQISSGYIPLSTWLMDEDETPGSVSPETPGSVSIRNARRRLAETLGSVSSYVATLDLLQPLYVAAVQEPPQLQIPTVRAVTTVQPQPIQSVVAVAPPPVPPPPSPPKRLLSGTDPAFNERGLYYNAFEHAFPAAARPKVRDSDKNQAVAQFLYTNGYEPMDVIPCVQEKLGEGKTDYRFEYLQEDMPRRKLAALRSSSVRGAGLKSAPTIPAVPSVSLGAPTMRGK